MEEKNLVFQYALHQGQQALAYQLQNIQHFEQVQKQTLHDILQNNKTTEYGQYYQFASITNPEEYSVQVPLSTYRVYKPYIRQMMADGSKNLLFSDELTGWASTSATSGNIKYIPQTHTLGDYYVRDYGLRGLALANLESIRKTGTELESGYFLLLFGNPVNYDLKEDGQECVPFSSIGSTSMLRVDAGLHSISMPPIRLLMEHTSLVPDLRYLYLRFALACRDIVYALSIYDDYILMILNYLEHNWEVLCDEIELGICSLPAYHSKSVDLTSYESFLKPDPTRANELRQILENGLQGDTLHRIWPKLQLVSAACKVGAFHQESNLVHFLDGISYDSSPYGATEGLFGLAAGPGDGRICLLPHTCYYEFIPAGVSDQEHPHTLSSKDLIDGELYELVVTTRGGFYRYRIGDLLRVTGRQDGCPLFTYEGRRGIGLNLVSEKSPEEALRNALIVAAVKCRISLVGYNMFGEGNRIGADGLSTLRYVVQFESKKELTDSEITVFANEIDHQIGCIVKSYAESRRYHMLQPLRAVQLPSGTYQAYDSVAREASQNPAQYKRPFIMKLGN